MTGFKILISAYACSPYSGSEPGVGWGFVCSLAKYHSIWVIVEEEKFASDIKKYIALNPEIVRSINFIFLKKKRNRLLRKIWPPSYYWYYRKWHKDAFLVAKKLHEEIKFDIAHQLTMVGFREPGYLWNLGIPFVWGPIGGMGIFPWRFLTKVGLVGAIYYFGYNIVNLCEMRFARRPKLAAQLANLGLIAMNSENQKGIFENFSMNSKVCIAVGPPARFAFEPTRRESFQKLKIVWSGLLIPRKALNLGLLSLSALPKEIEWELHILGAGSSMKKWQSLSKILGISERCFFYGNVPREDVFNVMESSHIHLFTSLREGTPSVIVEAHSFGLPTICFDISGMQDMVDDSCGIKVKLVSPKIAIRGLTMALTKIATDENYRYQLAVGALKRSKDFSWSSKVQFLNKTYQSLLTHGK